MFTSNFGSIPQSAEGPLKKIKNGRLHRRGGLCAKERPNRLASEGTLCAKRGPPGAAQRVARPTL